MSSCHHSDKLLDKAHELHHRLEIDTLQVNDARHGLIGSCGFTYIPTIFQNVDVMIQQVLCRDIITLGQRALDKDDVVIHRIAAAKVMRKDGLAGHVFGMGARQYRVDLMFLAPFEVCCTAFLAFSRGPLCMRRKRPGRPSGSVSLPSPGCHSEKVNRSFFSFDGASVMVSTGASGSLKFLIADPLSRLQACRHTSVPFRGPPLLSQIQPSRPQNCAVVFELLLQSLVDFIVHSMSLILPLFLLLFFKISLLSDFQLALFVLFQVSLSFFFELSNIFDKFLSFLLK
jgi:hypothetical protein